MKENKKRLVLLDAHAIIHRAYHALPDFVSSKGVPTGALYGLATMVLKIANDLKPDWIISAFDLPKPTHRHEAYKEYKAGRQKAEEELIIQLKKSRDLLLALSIPIYDKEGFEADDILGTIVQRLQTTNYPDFVPQRRGQNQGSSIPPRRDRDKLQTDIIIASGDMDTLQLVNDKKVQVYTLKKGINDTILYDEEAVFKRFGFSPKLIPDYKGLAGDPSDNIVGVRGVGDKTATTLIQNFGPIENIYKTLEKEEDALKKVGVKDRIIKLLKENKEEAEFSKILATIRKDAPIDFTLPNKVWVESVDIKKAEELFSDLEFRTMGQRLRKIVGNGGAEEERVSPNFASQNLGLSGLPTTNHQPQTSSIMLWLLNSSITNPTWEDVRTYTKKENPEEAERYLLSEIKKQGLLDVYEKIEKPLIPIIKKMNDRGVKIDIDFLKKMEKEYSEKLSFIEKEIWKYTGFNFNIASPKQLGDVLFNKLGLKVKNQKKTGGGALSTKESELQKMKDMHPVIALILEYRELAKLLTTYIQNIPQMIQKDGRLHADFLQAGTTTGRMASQNPNLQNIPNHTELGRRIRRAFIAEKGFKLVSFDYSQMELRIGAFLSKDKGLIEIFKKGEDIHSAVASRVFGVPIEKVDKEMRRRAKVINFGVMYGMGVNALRVQLGTDREEAEKFYDNYFAEFSGLANYLENVKESTKEKGFTETFFGRRRYFEGIYSKLPFIKASAERMAINAPIQGTGADIIKMAMKEVDSFLVNEGLLLGCFLILQVHDELVYEIKEDLVSKIAPKIKEIMENIISPNKIFGIKMLVSAETGDNWYEMSRF